MKKSFLSLVLIACIATFSYTNLFAIISLTNWQTYTSLNNSTCYDQDTKGNLWIGTKGGLYVYNPKDSTYQIYRNIDALIDLNISSIYCDSISQKVYVGSENGNLEIISPDGTIEHNFDIANTLIPNKSILNINRKDDKIYISGKFGLAVFNPSKNIFLEDVKRFGNFAQLAEVNKVIIHKDSIYAATSYGLAVANVNSSIASKSAWKNYEKESGLIKSNLKDMVFKNDTLYVASSKSIYRWNGFEFDLIAEYVDEISSIAVWNDKICVAIGQTIFLDLKDNPITIPNNSTINQIYSTKVLNQSKLAILSQNNGLALYDANSVKSNIFPNSPSANTFVHSLLDNNSNLWIATGDLIGKGVSKFDGETWTNFNDPTSGFAAAMKVNLSPNNSVMVSDFGNGFTEISPKNSKEYTFKKFNPSTNAKFVGTFNDNYFVAGDSKTDKNGTTWFVDYGEAFNGPMMVARDKNDNYYTFDNCMGTNKRTYNHLCIDSNGTKWLASTSVKIYNPNITTNYGLMYYNDKNTLEKTSDDLCGVVDPNNAPNIKSSTQTALVCDKAGLVWVGTLEGAAVIINPSAVLSKSNIQVREVKALRSQFVYCIMIDALNNKWFGTNNGIFVTNADGELIQTIDKSNSPLTNNTIYSLISNQETGQVYIGTSNGLFVANSSSVSPAKEYEISVYPAPFDPSKDEYMTIDGLAEASLVKIMSLDGITLRTLNTSSKILIWDGKDESGKNLTEGIYLVNAISSSSDAAGVAKFAIVKK